MKFNFYNIECPRNVKFVALFWLRTISRGKRQRLEIPRPVITAYTCKLIFFSEFWGEAGCLNLRIFNNFFLKIGS